MQTIPTNLQILLVDDEVDFRRATRTTFERRGFQVVEAENGNQAIEIVQRHKFDVAILDLKMPGLTGIETLQKLREIQRELPVIILTGHGTVKDALAGFKLEISEFLQKPVDIDLLCDTIKRLIEEKEHLPLREKSIQELMVPPERYPKIYIDQGISDVMKVLHRAVFSEIEENNKIRSVLVYTKEEEFVGILRFHDLLQSVLPPYLETSPYSTYFTGMFLAQCKLLGNHSVKDLIGDPISLDPSSPLLHAVNIMVQHYLVNLPIVENGKLIGVLREKDIINEIAFQMNLLTKTE